MRKVLPLQIFRPVSSYPSQSPGQTRSFHRWFYHRWLQGPQTIRLKRLQGSRYRKHGIVARLKTLQEAWNRGKSEDLTGSMEKAWIGPDMSPGQTPTSFD